MYEVYGGKSLSQGPAVLIVYISKLGAWTVCPYEELVNKVNLTSGPAR